MFIWDTDPGLELWWGSDLRVLVEPHCSGNWAHSHLHQRHSFTDSKMGWQIFSAIAIITRAFSWQPPQLIHIIVDVSYICSEHPWSDEIHGRGFHLQIPFEGGLPPTLVNGPIMFPLAMCGSMVEHLMEDEGPLQTLWPPHWELIKEDIGIQLPFHLPY